MSNTIHPLAFVDPKAKLGDNITIDAFAYIDADTEIGDNCHIYPHASICRGTRMGKSNKIYDGCVIGAEPQDFRWKNEKGECVIGDNNNIREHTIINRSIRDGHATRIGSNSFIMAQSHIGHDCEISDRCVLGNAVKLAGSVQIGTCTILSSGVIVHEGFHIGRWCLIKGGCRVTGNVPPYVIMAHNPITYFGVNAIVMAKGDIADEHIDDAAKCYRHLYQSGTSVRNALLRIKEDVAQSELRDNILDFLKSHDLKVAGIMAAVE